MKQILTLLVLRYLRFFAQLALKMHKPIIIGVAGSVGKSSTRNALYALLKDHFPTKMVYGNSETGIPLGILGIYHTGFSSVHWLIIMLKAPKGLFYLKHTKYLIVEMGIDEPFPPKNMSYLLTIVRPDIAISLNVSATHTMQFEKIIKKNQTFPTDKEKREFLIEKIAEEDTKIIQDSRCALGIFNKDDHHIVKALDTFLAKDKKTILQTFGQDKTNTIFYKDYSVSPEGSHFSFGISNSKESLTLFFPSLMLPKEYQELFAAVIMVGKYLGLSNVQIVQALETNFHLPHGRASLFQGTHHSLIIDSSYNASKDAVIAFLDMLALIKKQTKRPRDK